MLQARRLGNELYVGIHSDQAILENKGPTVMSLEERLASRSYVLKSPSSPSLTFGDRPSSESLPSMPAGGPLKVFLMLPT